MEVTYTLTYDQSNDWIHWEQGMLDVIPLLSMIDWMREQGYDYRHDWFFDHVDNVYTFTFPTEEIKTMFLLKFS